MVDWCARLMINLRIRCVDYVCDEVRIGLCLEYGLREIGKLY